MSYPTTPAAVNICCRLGCGRACGPDDMFCRKHGGDPAACAICGSLTCPGHVVAGAGIDDTSPSVLTPSLSAALASWNAHQSGCPQCVNAPNSAALCLAGSVLWQRAGLEVIPVAEPAPLLDDRHPSTLRTSELMRRVAGLVFQRPDGFAFSCAEELRARAAYLETLGDHDSPNGGAR